MKPKGFYTNGTAQSERLLQALQPSSVLVDERKLHDWLAILSELSGLINYYNEKLEVEGNWQPFFNHDIAILLSVINSTNLTLLEQQRLQCFRRLEHAKSEEESLAAFVELFQMTFDLAVLVNDWYKQAQQINTTDQELQLEKELRVAIQTRMAHNLQLLKAYELGAQEDVLMRSLLRFNYQEFDTIWEANALVKSQNIYAKGDTIREKAYHAQKSLQLVYKSFLNTVVFILSKVPKLLDHTLTKDPWHAPDTGLLITFLQLMQHLQDDLNQYTKKHLDFYYREVLKQSPQGVTPDRVPIIFSVNEGSPNIVLEQGSVFLTAPDDEGNSLEYLLEEELMLTHAQISSCKTLFVSKNPLVGANSKFRLVAGIYAKDIELTKKGPWATFGQEQLELPDAGQTMEQARTGLAIASPILLLSEGDRVVQICLKFDIKSLSTLIKLLTDISQHEAISTENAFQKVFANAIELHATTATGWEEISSYEIVPPDDWGIGEIIIKFHLSKSDWAIIPYDEELHGCELQSDWPVLQIRLNPYSGNYIYSFLRSLELEAIQIDASVQQLTSLSVFNDVGQVEASKPFYPFDALPRLGSYLLIGHTELFKKEITRLALDLEWHNLPQAPEDFKSYYQAYELGIDNDSFQVDVSALSEYEFQPLEAEERPVHTLFETATPEGLSKKTHIEITDPETLRLQPDFGLESLDVFDNQTKSGFVKLELVAPKVGFAHEEYPQLFTQAVTENAKPSNLFGTKKAEVPIPKEPFVPMIRKVSVSYEASTSLIFSKAYERGNNVLSKEKVFHLHPFGHEVIYQNGKSSRQSLLPVYSDEGHLFIGLTDLNASEPLSIHFQLVQGFQQEYQINQLPHVKWSYLRHNEWVSFSQEQLLADGTGGFTQSGIVSLMLPTDITLGNTILPAEVYWLKVAVKDHTSMLGKVVQISTQAGMVKYAPKPEDSSWEEVLPPNAILEMKNQPEGIEQLLQPYASIGGKHGENDTAFYTRVSELLKHKSRAVQLWDYERIVLDAFPFIHQIKCLGHQNHERFVPKGMVKAVVVPQLMMEGAHKPQVNYHRLQEVERVLKQSASSFSKIEVINPIYESVKVACNVMFEDMEEQGKFLNMLNQDIHRFICPWYFDTTQELPLGGNISKEALHAFIEDLPYVKYITRFSAVHVKRASIGFELDDTANMKGATIMHATTPWSVLVPAEFHQIQLIDRQNYQSPDRASIATIGISSDFVVSPSEEDDRDEQEVVIGNPEAQVGKQRRFFFSIDLKKR